MTHTEMTQAYHAKNEPEAVSWNSRQIKGNLSVAQRLWEKLLGTMGRLVSRYGGDFSLPQISAIRLPGVVIDVHECRRNGTRGHKGPPNRGNGNRHQRRAGLIEVRRPNQRRQLLKKPKSLEGCAAAIIVICQHRYSL